MTGNEITYERISLLPKFTLNQTRHHNYLRSSGNISGTLKYRRIDVNEYPTLSQSIDCQNEGMSKHADVFKHSGTLILGLYISILHHVMIIPEFNGVFAVRIFKETNYSPFSFLIKGKIGGKYPTTKILQISQLLFSRR
jgi:hypothetical protein